MSGDEIIETLADYLGMNTFDEKVDDVIFQTNEFLTDATFIGAQGPFWWILQTCMALGATFAIIMAAGMAYKMMAKGEPFDVLKILRVLGIAIVMCCWFPGGAAGESSILGALSYIPNCIGSFVHDLYEGEAYQIQNKFEEIRPLIVKRDSLTKNVQETSTMALEAGMHYSGEIGAVGTEELVNTNKESMDLVLKSDYTGLMVFLDKLVMLLSIAIFRVGWWGTIYCQQILLGMLTIFGPIQWAFSILPKWEGAWAKWITRYLTVHFYGAMLYFVGFYVLLLFDIVLSIQFENLTAITSTQGSFNGYITNAFMTAGYLLVASIVSLKCLSLVPDLAAWVIPEGDTAFSTRNFGEGVASGMKSSVTGIMSRIL